MKKEEIDLVNELGITSEEEIAKRDARWEKWEKDGVRDVLKYFDRIHDKLFNFNNILIAGYFTISKIFNYASPILILIPISNLAVLVFIEYRMMEKSRFDSEVTKKTILDIQGNRRRISKTNLYSLYSIISTSIVLLIFLYQILSK